MAKRKRNIEVPEKPVVPGYDLIRRIGKGASGDVWICKNMATKKILAVKIIWNLTRDERVWFKKELNGLTEYEKIDPKPDTLLDIRHVQKSEDGRYLYYTMPLADGVSGTKPESKRYEPLTLHHRLEAEGMLGLRDATAIASRVAEALNTFHSVSLIHRDVKPANIIFIREKAVLADIGLVTEASGDVSNAGTPLYRETGEKPSVKGDVYALGKVLYQMINGRDPGDFPSPGSRADDKDLHLFGKLNLICFRACDNEDRYQNADQMLADLREVLSMPDRQAPSPIDVKYAKLGGRECFLGEPTHNEQACADGVGRYRTYKHTSGTLSSIHWHPDVGAFETHGGIRSEWEKRNGERSFLGYPVSDEDGFTDADYLRDIMGKPAEGLPEVPRMIGWRSLFQGGCIVWLHDPDIRSKCGEFAVFCRPVADGDVWRIVVKDKPSKSYWDSIMEYLPGKSDSALPSTILEKQLDRGYAAKAWATWQKAAEQTEPINEPVKEDAPAEEPTASEDKPQDPDNASPAQPTIVDLVHPSDHLLAGTGPIWDLQGGPDEFAWEGRGGRLYKMTAPYKFIEGQPELNEKALAKVRVAIFLPPDFKPDTPMVYTLADTGEDYRANVCMVPTVLDSGYGMVAIDTPMTGICKFGADLVNGSPINIDSDFAAAVRATENKCGAKNMGGPFTYHLHRVTARNLRLTQHFLEKEFGIAPKRTVLTGVGFGVQTAAFAFNATGFSDVMLGFIGIPELLGRPKENPIQPAGAIAEKSGTPAPSESMQSFFGRYFFETLPSAFEALQELFKTIPPVDDCFAGRINPATYAYTVRPHREIHLLCGCSDQLFPEKIVTQALKRYKNIKGSDTCDLPLSEAGRNSWPHALKRALGHGKSVVWFDGGHDLSGWRGDLRLKFLETKLRMLNGDI